MLYINCISEHIFIYCRSSLLIMQFLIIGNKIDINHCQSLSLDSLLTFTYCILKIFSLPYFRFFFKQREETCSCFLDLSDLCKNLVYQLQFLSCLNHNHSKILVAILLLCFLFFIAALFYLRDVSFLTQEFQMFINFCGFPFQIIISYNNI